jgi:hypothetical protein
MSGHGEKLTRRQEAAIAALLTAPTLADAAAAAGVSHRTLKRWIGVPEFSASYRQARRQVVEVVIGRLQQIAAQAVKTLERNLTCGQPAGEIRAALGVLDHATKGVELIDLAARVEELGRLLEEVRRDAAHPPRGEAAGRSQGNG